jgi:hypothetical protein
MPSQKESWAERNHAVASGGRGQEEDNRPPWGSSYFADDGTDELAHMTKRNIYTYVGWVRNYIVHETLFAHGRYYRQWEKVT